VSSWAAAKATAILVALVVCAAPAAAFVCHPDAPSTRSLVVGGPIRGYAFDGSQVEILHGGNGACYRSLWHPLASPAHAPSTSRSRVDCASMRHVLRAGVTIPTHVRTAPTALDGHRRAIVSGPRTIDVFRGQHLISRLTRRSSAPLAKLVLSSDRLVAVSVGDEARDIPARLEVYDIRRGLLRSIPLVDRPRTLAVSGDVAVFAAAGGHGTSAVRLSDGRTTFVSPTRPFDTPQLGPLGLVLQSNLYKRFASSGRVVVKFIPTRVLDRGFEATFAQLTLRWPIRAMALDGPRTAFVLDAPRGGCDEVRYWNIPWHYVIRVSMRTDMTCSRAMDIRNVALGGITTAWLGEWAGERLVITSDSQSCIERLMAKSSVRNVMLAGDRGLMAFGIPTPDRRGTTVGFLRAHPDGSAAAPMLLHVGAPVKALAVDANRVALQRLDGRVELRDARGRLLRTIAAPGTRAIALRGDRLFVLSTTGRLEARDVTAGTLRNAWRLPDRPVTLDVHYGIAVTASSTAVRAIDLSKGRTAILSRRAMPSLLAIEASGVVYGYNERGRGVLRTLSIHDLERALATS
jgi:hypothetical protein